MTATILSREAAKRKLAETLARGRTKPEPAKLLPESPLQAILYDTDYGRQIAEALEALAQLEAAEDTALWLASLEYPLDEEPPERDNPFSGEPIIEAWDQRAARMLWTRAHNLEDENAAA